VGVCEVTNKQKQRQWKQGTKAREQGNKVKQGTRAKGNRPGKVVFFTTKLKLKKNEEKRKRLFKA